MFIIRYCVSVIPVEFLDSSTGEYGQLALNVNNKEIYMRKLSGWVRIVDKNGNPMDALLDMSSLLSPVPTPLFDMAAFITSTPPPITSPQGHYLIQNVINAVPATVLDSSVGEYGQTALNLNTQEISVKLSKAWYKISDINGNHDDVLDIPT